MIEYSKLLIKNGQMIKAKTKQLRKKSGRTNSSTSKMSQKKTTLHIAKMSPRDTLIAAARHLFAIKGLSATSIRDIANEAQLNSSAISYYFDGKDGLYRACLEEIGKTQLDFAQRILQSPSTSEEFKVRLELFIDHLIDVFLTDRDTGLLVIREYDRRHSPAEDIFRTHFFSLFEVIIHFFKAAQQEMIISERHDPTLVASLFFGALKSQFRLDHFSEKAFKRSLKRKKDQEELKVLLVELFMNI